MHMNGASIILGYRFCVKAFGSIHMARWSESLVVHSIVISICVNAISKPYEE